MQFHKGTGYVADRHRYAQRDGIRSATASPQRQERRFAHSQNDNRFDRATHRERAEETRTSLTERVRRNYTGQSKIFSVYYNVVSPSSYNQLLRREGDQINSTSSAGGRELNDHTCTHVHLDVTDALDASLALCHLHKSTITCS
jgi:hypothetical protein